MQERLQGFGNSAAGSAAAAALVAALTGVFALAGSRLLMLDLVLAYGGLAVTVAFTLGRRPAGVAAAASTLGFAALVLAGTPDPPISDVAALSRALAVAAVVSLVLYAIPRWLTREAEYKRVADELAQSQRRFATIMTYSTDVLVEMREGVVTYVGPNAAEQEYLDARALLGHRMSEFICPEDLPRMARYAEPGWIGPIRDRFRVRDRGGRWRWVETSGFRSRAADGSYGAVHLVRDVDAEQRQSDELRASEERLRALLANVQLAAVQLDTDGRVAFANPYFLALTGFSLDEVLGVAWFERFVPTEAQEDVQEVFDGLLSSGEPSAYRNAIVTKTGERRLMEWSNVPVRDAEGRVTGTFSLAADVTERTQAEEALRTSEERFRSLLENVNLVGGFVNAEGIVEYANPYFLRLSGYSRDEVVGQPMMKFVPAQQASDVAGYVRELSDGANSRNAIVTKSGEERLMEWSNVVVRDASGNAIGTFGLGADITERAQAEAALRASEEQLNEAQRIARIGSWELNLVSNVLTWSDEIYRIFEIDRERFAASYEGFLNAIHPDDRETVDRAYTTSVEARSPYEITHRLLMADGRIKWVQERSETFYAEDGKPLRSLGTVQDITEQVQAAEALHIEHAAIESSINGIAMSGLDGALTYVNPAFVGLWGLDAAEEALGRSALEFWETPEQAAEVIAALGRDGSWRGEMRAMKRDGSRFIAEVAAHVVSDSQGNPVRMMASFLDVTAQREAEEHRADLARVVEDSLNEVYIFDEATLRFMVVNRSARENIGYTMEELAGMTPVDLKPLVTAETFGALVHPLRSGQQNSVTFETVHRRKDGTTYQVEVHLQLGSYARKRAFTAIILDITERAKTEQAVRESEARYRTLAEQAPLGIVTLDLEGRVTSINPAALRIVGESEDVAGMRIGRQTLNMPQVIAAGLDQMIRVVRDERAIRRQELTYASSVGKNVEISLDMAPLLDSDGAPSGIIVIFEDVTERKRLESRDLQSQKMEAIGRLAGGVAHDVNNLMTAITVTTELDMAKLPAEQVLRDDLREIHETAQRAADLAGQLLTFSRRQIIEPRAIDLCALVAGTHRMLSRLIGEDIEFIVRPHREPCFVLADPGQMEQVLVNLAVNARDAMPNGGTLTIAVGRAARNGSGERVALTVSDTGTGIPAYAREHIFEPFFTTKGRGQGTGLGLATVYGIVQQAGGEIEVASGGHGTTFTITLPLHQDGAGDQAVRDEPERLPGGSETILLVEDEPAVRRPAARALRELGYTVLEAGDGASALAVFEERASDIRLVVTDVVMPRMSGASLCGRLRERWPDLLVLFTSGYTDSNDVRGQLRPGIIEFISKPFSQQEMAERIRAMLDGRYSPAMNS